MKCPSCSEQITPDSFYCTWCSAFVPDPSRGTKANVFTRWVALVLDPMIAVVLWAIGFGLADLISTDLGVAVALLFPAIYLVWFVVLLGRGLTPGKKLLGLRVVHRQSGAAPGFGTMFLREIVGRFVSGLIFGLGYLWALFDKNGQAWHDKLAGTVVLKAAAPK